MHLSGRTGRRSSGWWSSTASGGARGRATRRAGVGEEHQRLQGVSADPRKVAVESKTHWRRRSGGGSARPDLGKKGSMAAIPSTSSRFLPQENSARRGEARGQGGASWGG